MKEQAKLEPGSRCGLPGEGCVAEHGRSNTEQDNEARAMKQFAQGNVVLSERSRPSSSRLFPRFGNTPQITAIWRFFTS